MFGFVGKLLNRHRAALLWSKAVGEFRAGKSQDAIKSVMEIENFYELKPVHLAYIGQIYTYDGKGESAKPYFERAIKATEKMESVIEIYINLFSRIYLDTINTQIVPSDLIVAAQKTDCGPALKRWLPLSTDDTVFKPAHLFARPGARRS